jgi:hypothetical protein
MRRFIVSLFVLCLSLCPVLALAQESGKEQAAIAASEQWLSLVDSGRFGQSWKQTAGYFRAGFSKTSWRNSIMAVRKPLGRLKSRAVISSVYTPSLPGAPDGEYVVIQFETSFENKQSAVETLTPLLEKDGSWRVSGYYIR